MMGNSKFEKSELQEVTLTQKNTDEKNKLIIPLPYAQNNEEFSDKALQPRLRPGSTQPFSKLSQVLLIECMLKKMCASYVEDPRKKVELYNVVRRYLIEFHLLPKIEELPEMERIHLTFTRDLNKLFRLAVKEISPNDSSSRMALAKPLQTSRSLCPSDDGGEYLFPSRYEQDFEEEEFIASGGFGVVYRAKNVLDKTEYAIKKVIIRPRSASRLVREVQLLSSLNHPNIVVYKSAWLEHCSPQTLHEILQRMGGSSFSSHGESSHGVFAEESRSFEESSYSMCNSNRSESIVFESSSSVKTSVRHVIKSRNTSSTPGVSLVLNQGAVSAISSKSTFFEQTRTLFWDHVVTPSVMLLYIQMELCPQTLRQWLNTRNIAKMSIDDISYELTIFRQILHGICYIHSHKIVHRDIKPDNIFIDTETKQIRIGDFGLAKLGNDDGTSNDLLPANLSDKTLKNTRGVGTHSYAAPEQLANNGTTAKSDIYSLGIVLLELLAPFTTDMERHKTIQNLRKHHVIPSEIHEKWPTMADLIKNMTTRDPLLRHSAVEVAAELQSYRFRAIDQQRYDASDLSQSPEDTISQLLLVIENLKKEIANKNVIIDKLTTNADLL